MLMAANSPPTIGAISNRVVLIDQPTLPIELVVADPETPKTNLLLSAVSSDQSLVPDANLFLGSLGSFLYVTVTPAFGRTGTAIITVTVSDGTNSASTNFNFTALSPPAGSGRFANTNLINIPTSGVAAPYPSTIEVTGLTGTVSRVELTLSGFQHEFPEDIRMLLSAPGGSGALFFAHVGGGRPVTNVTVTVTDFSPFPLPDEFQLISEPLRPANYGTNNTLPVPAPAGPFGTNFATFNGTDPNGTWSLYIVDDIAPDFGVVAGGWSLLIAAAEGPLPPTISDITNQFTTSGVPTPVIPFTVGDPDTLASNLVVSGFASNPTLVPTNFIVFGGAGSNRTVRVTPAFGQSGVTIITVLVSDGTNTASDTFQLTVNAANTPPVISGVPDQIINEDTVLGPLAFTVTDAEQFAGSLVVNVGASNPALVPTNNFLLGGSGSNRTVTLAPAPNANGTTTITLVVSDGNLFTSTNLVLTVNPVNDGPTISDIPNRLTTTNTPTPALPLTLGDVDTPPDSLILTAGSSNPALVPTNSIVFGGSGADRTVTLTPADGLTGTSTITLTVNDGALGTNDTFVLTVIASNSPPVISALPDQVIDEDTNTGPVPFTIGDAETGVGNLVMTRASSNPALVPTNNIIIAGGTSNRTVTVTPLPNQNGSATITVGVEDGQYLVLTNFLLAVNPVNDRPTVSVITNRIITLNETAGPIAFVIGDLETAAGSLTVAAGSSDQILLPDANINLAGSGSNRTVTLRPASNEVGVVTITLSVSDGLLSTNRSFVLTVTPPDTAPTIGGLPDVNLFIDQPSDAWQLALADLESPAVDLFLSATSSDTNVVPVENIFFGTIAPYRYLTVTPGFGQVGSSVITISVSDGIYSTSTNFLVTVSPPPPGAARFANTTPITIPNVGPATPYPAVVQVAGMIGTVTNLELTLSRLNHEFVTDLDLLLVSPSGQGVVVFSHAAQGNSASNVTVTLTDRSPYPLPQSFAIWSQPLRPTDWSGSVLFPAPAPAGPYGAVAMSTFNGLNPNGDWSLYVYDDFAPDHGLLSGGWSLMVATTGGSGGAPTISDITNRTTLVNTPTAAIPFVIGDEGTAAEALVLSAASSNPLLVPTNNIQFGGSGSNRLVTVTPLPDQVGSVTITVTVGDGIYSASDSFLLTVSRAPLTVSAGSTNRLYGATNPVFAGTLAGVQPGDNITASFTTTATVNSPVGNHPITALLNDPFGRLGNYIITTNQGTLTITPAALIVTVDSTNRTYGAANPAFTGVLAGLLNGDNITATLSAPATSNSPAGTYPINLGLNDPGAKLGNYSVTTNAGTLTVVSAPLIIRAEDKSRGYGATNPAFTATYAGLMNGETTAALSGAPAFSTPAGPGSDVGSYAIQVAAGTLSNANYAFAFSNGTLTVTAAVLTVTVQGTNRLYGQDNPAFTGELTGLVNDDNITADFITTATTNSPVGVYAIAVALADPGARLGNYAVTTNAGTLAVLPAGTTNDLVSSLNPAPAGSSITFTAMVGRAQTGAGLPTGSVQFFTNGFALGAPVVLSGGLAVIGTATLQVGTNLVLAAYLGDGNFIASTGGLFQVVNSGQTAAPPAILSIVNDGAGTNAITFVGTPGALYVVETAPHLLPPIPWAPWATNAAGPNGQWLLLDSTSATQRFYRATVP